MSETNEEIQEAIADGIPICLGEAPFVQRVVITDFESGENVIEVWLANGVNFDYTTNEPTCQEEDGR